MEKQTRAMDFSDLEKVIVLVKGQNVIIDSDVARIYNTETREINKAIKNNPGKFPTGYIIEADKVELVENFHQFKNLKHSTVQPKAFTEKGLYMLATILKSPQATAATISIIDERSECRGRACTDMTERVRTSKGFSLSCKEAEKFSLN